METVSSDKWYHKPLGIVLLLIVFFPIGLYLMWRYANWTPRTKGIVTAVVVGLFGLISLVDTPEPQRTIATNTEPPRSTVIVANPTQTPAPSPIEKREIIVTS